MCVCVCQHNSTRLDLDSTQTGSIPERQMRLVSIVQCRAVEQWVCGTPQLALLSVSFCRCVHTVLFVLFISFYDFISILRFLMF